MSVAAWASYLPQVHPFLLDMAQTIDRTVSRFEGRIGVLQVELAQIRAAITEGGELSERRAERAKLTAYEQEIAEYQATISECHKQFHAQVAKRWTATEIAYAKSSAGGLAGEPAVIA